jgi:cytochrome c-type biogenesis protein CcmF
MIPELGHFALILALCLALIQSVVPLVGAARGIPSWVNLAWPAARAQFAVLLLSYLALTWAFLGNDFSVLYAANNSNSGLPMMYRVSAVWGAHEGSLLLWALVLAIWTLAVTHFSRSLPRVFAARVIAVMGLISVGFLLFMLLTSNPFERVFPAPMDGRDLNPLLQDPGLIIHPPMLYLGYVGFSVAFAFAIAALLDGRLDSAWARWSRPWTTAAWIFLTVGITLGSWWAYYELGWGGWWFWDPVENASFMPWLVGTALIHSLAVSDKRGTAKNWTVLLAISAFSLSLLGTFLVRSGVITSVHAFASDPARGVFILAFLGVVVGGSLTLYAWRAPSTRDTGGFSLLSRETLLLGNSLFFVVSAGTVLLGTIYPLIVDALGLGKLSVGPPYFNSVFVPLMVPVVLLIGIGPLARWKRQEWKPLAQRLAMPALTSIVLGVLAAVMVGAPGVLGVGLGVALAAWVAVSMLQELRHQLRNRSSVWRGLRSLRRGYYGMTVAHLGVAVFIVGVTVTSVHSTEKDIRLDPGESTEVGSYDFRFEGARQVAGPNYRAMRGTVVASRGDERIVLEPEKRIYQVQQMPMTEAAIDAGFTRDLYVALGEELEGGAWALRVYHKPFIRWVWLGTLMMALGGLLAASDRRYRRVSVREPIDPVPQRDAPIAAAGSAA